MRPLTLESVGLCTVEDAANRLDRGVRQVQKWIAAGKLPAIAIGAGNRTVYLLRIRDVDKFEPPKRGRPVAQN